MAKEAKTPSIIRDEHQPDVSAKRSMKVPDSLQREIEYSSGNPIYMGFGAQGIATTNAGWLIHKFTWSGSDMTVRQTAFGAWDSRATLTYS